MSGRNDLTRWNRAALTRFRYVDGNAVEYLEALRQQLVKQFGDPETGLCEWLKPSEELPANEKESDNESLIQRQERLSQRRERILDTYRQGHRDWAWEITRTFARACHILTEHADAYANEGYLGTATQWDNVRRLVEMLDYHPAPPASASTRLVLEAKESKAGLVKKGWQVKYKPQEGDKVVFETLEDIQVHHELNGMRLDGYNKSPKAMSDSVDDPDTWGWVTEKGEGIGELELSAGNVAVLVNELPGSVDQAIAVIVDEVDSENSRIKLSGVSGINKSWKKGTTHLRLSPKDILTPHLNGAHVVRFFQAHGLSEGDVIAWNSGEWHFDKVIESDALSIKLQTADPMPAADIGIFKAFRIPRPPESGSTFMFPYHFTAIAKRNNTNYIALVETDYTKIDVEDEEGSPVPSHCEISKTTISEIFLVPSSATPIGRIETQEPADYIFDGSPGDLASGQWIVAENDTCDHMALKICAITEYEDHFAVSFGEPSVTTGDGATATSGASSLKRKVRQLQGMLDESAMAEITLGHFISGKIEERDAICIEGIGEEYYDWLRGSKKGFTLGQLAKTGSSDRYGKVTEVRLERFRTLAEWVLEFQREAKSFEKAAHLSLSDVLSMPEEKLGELIKVEEQSSESAKNDAIKRIFGSFEHTLYPKGHDRNETALGSVDALMLTGKIGDEARALLKPGRLLVLEREDGSGDPVAIEVSKLEVSEEGGITLYLPRKLQQDEKFSEGNLVIRGNVVLSGHGESQPEKILGSGKAMLSNQSFTLKAEKVSFTADATKSAGVAAAMDVSVNGQIWQQVSTLNDSVASDPHYDIRMTEEGYVNIAFGDGEHGRRLPTGSNNVRVRYRVGSGLAGNVPAGGLEKPVNPHPLVGSVRQPFKAAGGGDMEDVASLRENAPPTLLALERAVSLSDFTHLAVGLSSIWQANAYREILHGGRMESVKVVIVPAGGAYSPDINDALTSFLQAHAMPGVRVIVRNFKSVRFDLKVTVRVKYDEYIPEEVKKAVESALSEYFALKNRKLGANLYLSEAYKVVEGIQGVENSICVLNGDEAIQVIRPGDEEIVSDGETVRDEEKVIYLDTSAGEDETSSSLYVAYEEYLP